MIKFKEICLGIAILKSQNTRITFSLLVLFQLHETFIQQQILMIKPECMVRSPDLDCNIWDAQKGASLQMQPLPQLPCVWVVGRWDPHNAKLRTKKMMRRGQRIVILSLSCAM